MELTEKEWQVLREMCRNLLRGASDTGMGYYSVGDTLIDEEVELLKKIAKNEPD